MNVAGTGQNMRAAQIGLVAGMKEATESLPVPASLKRMVRDRKIMATTESASSTSISRPANLTSR
jgi:hypothetical protein